MSAPGAPPLSKATAEQNRGPGQIACMIVTSTAALIAVSLRLYVRRSVVRRFGLDDWTIIVAMIFGLITLATDSVKFANGFGRHVPTLTPSQLSAILKYSIIGTPTLIISQGLSKISICFLLLRLLSDAKAPKRKIALNLIILFLAMYTLMVVIILLAQCNPISRVWNHNLAGSCWNPKVVENAGITHGVCSTVTAFLLSAMPVLILGNLNLNQRTKIAVCVLLGLGVFDGACSIMRTIHTPGFNQNPDFSYTQVPLYLWADLEQNLAIIAACIPTLRPLFRFFGHSKAQSSGWTSKGYNRRSGIGHQRIPSHAQLGSREDDWSYALTRPTASHASVAQGDDSERNSEVVRTGENIWKTTEITIRS